MKKNSDNDKSMKLTFGFIVKPVFLVLLFSIVSPFAYAEQITLINGGKSDYVIVVSDLADITEKTAAKELQSHLEMSSIAILPIVAESEVLNGSGCISIGKTKIFECAYPDFDWTKLGCDGIVIRTKGKDLFIAGGHPRGTLYAVYTFLEDIVGFRWWSSSETYVPSASVLTIPKLDKIYVPQLLIRDAYYRDVINNPLFSVKLKLNGQVTKIPQEYGGSCPILGFVHTFNTILPSEKYFSEHPEWYSMEDGIRKQGWGQLCLTNEEMRKEFLKNTLKWISENPSLKIVSISQNDGGTFCQCTKCKALEDSEGSASGPLIDFVNYIAAEVEEVYPDVLVETLAYMDTRKSPNSIRPRDNVVIRLCTMECTFSQPLETGEYNVGFQFDMKDWSNISSKLLIWNYVTNFLSYIEPHPNLNTLGEDIRYFIKNKAVGVFEQGDSGSTCSDFPELRSWLLAHLMWNPELDDKALITEFLVGYYGDAAEPIQHYINLISDTLVDSGIKLGTFNLDTSEWFTPEAINRATELFNQAELKVKDDPIKFGRVRRARMPLDNVWLKRYDFLKLNAKANDLEFNGPQDIAAFARNFIDRMRSSGSQSYREGYPIVIYELQLQKKYLNSEVKLPKLCENLPESQYIIVQNGDFEYFRWGQYSLMADDPDASNGKAATTQSNHKEWALQYVFRDERVSGEWQCFAELRVNSKVSQGEAFEIGIYDMENEKFIVKRTVRIEELSRDGYTTIDLGLHKNTTKMHLYVAPCNNPEQVDTIYFDRLFFVKNR